MKIFDSHFHIFDYQFPLEANHGFLPAEFKCADYLTIAKKIGVVGGALVSASFQGYDQNYLISALKTLGSNFVGITQLPYDVSDETIIQLNEIGVRGIRFNLKRSLPLDIKNITTLATRVFDIAKWHSEFYVDSSELEALYPTLIQLPIISIDHLGLTQTGYPHLLKLIEKGAYVKATGFGRLNFDPLPAIKEITTLNPNKLLFGTDLPSTRTSRPFHENDIQLIQKNLDPETADKVLFKNAVNLYRIMQL